MPLVLLYLADEVTRFNTVDDAKVAGAQSHTVTKSARIEVTPDGGGPIFTLEYDPTVSGWISGQ